VSDIRHGKYAGRVTARVHTATGLDLATALLFEGFARVYQGRGCNRAGARGAEPSA
jgi:endonuclease YncB( thermonuclease family)